MKKLYLLLALLVAFNANAQYSGPEKAAMTVPEYVAETSFTTGSSYTLNDGQSVTIADPALESDAKCRKDYPESTRAARYQDMKFLVNRVSSSNDYVLFDAVKYKTDDPITMLKSGQYWSEDLESTDFHLRNYAIAKNGGSESLKIICVKD